MRIAINGFGRIGRLTARQLFLHPELREKITLVAVNDLGTPEESAFLLKHDTTHGTYPHPVSADKESITIDGQRVAFLKTSNAAELPWKALNIDLVLECTGRFVAKDSASVHLNAGAKRVVISAPGKGVDLTVVMGVNHKTFDPTKHTVLSNASCTTNCLAPVAHVIHAQFGINQGLMTTIHSYTSDQRLIDNAHTDLRRARSAACNMIPTSTGAAKTVGEVIPALKGKLDGLAIRVPTANVSITDVVFCLEKRVTKEEINAALKQASEGELSGILGFSNEPLVSSDYNGCTLSSIVDADCTHTIPMKEGGTLAKICAWYDNEVGFSVRMLELAAYIGSKA